jgi:hypothetical protein
VDIEALEHKKAELKYENARLGVRYARLRHDIGDLRTETDDLRRSLSFGRILSSTDTYSNSTIRAI